MRLFFLEKNLSKQNNFSKVIVSRISFLNVFFSVLFNLFRILSIFYLFDMSFEFSLLISSTTLSFAILILFSKNTIQLSYFSVCISTPEIVSLNIVIVCLKSIL